MSEPGEQEDIRTVPAEELVERIPQAVRDDRMVIRAAQAINELRRRDPELTFRHLWAVTGVPLATLQRWSEWSISEAGGESNAVTDRE